MSHSPVDSPAISHRTRAVRPAVLMLGLCIMTLAACGAWVRIPAPGPAVLPPDQRVQVWRGTDSWILMGVTVGTDSLWGAPLQPTGEPAGRLALARSEVDSFRVETGSQGSAPIFAFIGGFVLALEFLRHAWST